MQYEKKDVYKIFSSYHVTDKIKIVEELFKSDVLLYLSALRIYNVL